MTEQEKKMTYKEFCFRQNKKIFLQKMEDFYIYCWDEYIESGDPLAYVKYNSVKTLLETNYNK